MAEIRFSKMDLQYFKSLGLNRKDINWLRVSLDSVAWELAKEHAERKKMFGGRL